MAKAEKTYFEVLQWASSFLERAGKEKAAAEFMILGRLGWNKTQWLVNMKENAPEEFCRQIETDMQRIAENYPPQYLLGNAEFYGENFIVTAATLIPRPETEELVELCLQKNPDGNLKVLDIGTGTGAIAITLKKQRASWQVTATDLSEEALKVARENADNLAVEVKFLQGDLTAPVATEKFAIILSNPPYIAEEEWDEMDESVRLYEPKSALFAENHGLRIYQRLARELPNILASQGQVFLEIGYQQGVAVQQIFQKTFPSKKIEIVKDLSGHDRMIYIYDEHVDNDCSEMFVY